MVLVVSKDDAGLHVFPTHRVFADRPDLEALREGEAYADLEEALRTLDAEPYNRPAVIAYRRGRVEVVRGLEGELDTELVDRHGLDRHPLHAPPGRGGGGGRQRRGGRRLPAPRAARRRRVRRRTARRADAAEEHVLLPQAAVGAPLPPARPMTPWLETCRLCVADIRAVLERLPTRVGARAGAAAR